jgi:hypothetical protein
VALLAVKVGRRQKYFTADDLWKAGLPQIGYDQALPGVMKRLKAKGVLAASGYYTRSPRTRGLVVVWTLSPQYRLRRPS